MFLGAALAKSRAKTDAAPQQAADPSARRRRRQPERWDVETSCGRTPRSSDDTKDSIAEWRANRSGSRPVTPDAELPKSDCADFNCERCVAALDYCTCGQAILLTPRDRRSSALEDWTPHPDDSSLFGAAMSFFEDLMFPKESVSSRGTLIVRGRRRRIL